MIEKRHPIRRNITGGLSLGLFAGLFLAFPDVVTSLFYGLSIKYISGIISFHIGFGIIGGGISGIIYGILVVVGEKYGEDRNHRLKIRSNFAFFVCSLFVLYLVSKLNFSLMIKISFIIIYVLTFKFLIVYIFKYFHRTFSGYNNIFKNILVSLIFLISGMFCTFKFGGILVLDSAIYWEILGLLLILAGLLDLFVSFKMFKPSKNRRGLAILAKPFFTTFILIFSIILSRYSSYALENVESKKIEKIAPVSIKLIKGDKTKKLEDKKIVKNRVFNAKYFKFPKNSSIVILTQTKGNFQKINSWNSNQVVLPSPHTPLILGSLFSGKHFGLRHFWFPHVSGKSSKIIEKLKNEYGYELYNLSSLKPGSYFRETPNFGFPNSISMNKNTNKKIVQTLEIIGRFKAPFIVWLNIDQKPEKKIFDKFVKYMKAKKINLFYLSWDKAKTSTGVVLGNLQIVSSQVKSLAFNHSFPLTPVLPSLLRITFKNLDQKANKFPPINRKSIFVNSSGPVVVSTSKKVSLKGIRGKIKKSLQSYILPIDFLSSERIVEKQLRKLDQLICKEYINPKEKKYLEKFEKIKNLNSQILIKLEILKTRAGLIPPPKWMKNYLQLVAFDVFSMKSNQNSSLKDLIIDPFVAQWIYKIFKLNEAPELLLKKCPGIVFQ
jgi:hypothetical protein